MLKILLLTLSTVCFAKYTNSPPLMNVIKTKVNNCKNPNVIPAITWGGDISTVLDSGGYSLVRKDDFSSQIQDYLSCQSPFLRGTVGMLSMAAQVTERDPRTKMVVFYQMTWSAGGDAMVVKKRIKNVKDIKTIAMQAYGPHVDYAMKVLKDGGVDIKKVKIRWVKDITGAPEDGNNTPALAFSDKDVDAAMMIIPDALAITSGGAEGSVSGSKILLSTKTAPRIISDVYAVRSDYFSKNKDSIRSLTKNFFKNQSKLHALMRDGKSKEYKELMKKSAVFFFDAPSATADVKAMYHDAEFSDLSGNAKFFSDRNYLRNFQKLSSEAQSALIKLGLTKKKYKIATAGWNYSSMGKVKNVESETFNNSKLASLVTKKQKQNSLSDGELFSFEIFFSPNQTNFSSSNYSKEFDKILELSSTYKGAVVTIEGHSDPLGYLKKKRSGSSQVVLTKIKQSARNLSVQRSLAVRDSLIQYSESKKVSLDKSQFVPIGHGIGSPKFSPPKTKDQWLSNMRVEFKIIQVEAEESVFSPL